MSKIQFDFGQAGRTAYCLVRDRDGRPWNNSGAGAFENYATANYARYTTAAVEQGSASAYYTADFPTAIAPGIYSVVAKEQAGGSPAESDRTVAGGDVHWDGSRVVSLADLATSGQVAQFAPLRFARSQMFQNFMFKLVSDADNKTPFVSGVVSGQIAKDGGGFGPLQSGSFTEVGNGWYRLQALTSGDLNCNAAALVFTAAGVSGGNANQRDIFIATQRTSGY